MGIVVVIDFVIITWSDTAHVGFTLDQFITGQDVSQVTILSS